MRIIIALLMNCLFMCCFLPLPCPTPLAPPKNYHIFVYGLLYKVPVCGKNQREQKPRGGRTRDFNAADNPEAKRACRLTGKFSCSVTTFFESCRCSVSPHKPTTAAAPCVPFYLRPTGGCLATLRTAGPRQAQAGRWC